MGELIEYNASGALTTTDDPELQAIAARLAATDARLAAFADFLRVDVANGDASRATIRTYAGQVMQYIDWCAAADIHPAAATVADVKRYRSALVGGAYARATIASKLQAVGRLYAALQANGARPDNPAEGVKAPPDRTDRAERVKWLGLADMARLLAAPDATSMSGKRDAAIIALMALHGLRVSEVARLDVSALDLDAGTIRIMGKGQKVRTALLVGPSTDAIRSWLLVREDVAAASVSALIVSLHHPAPGTRMGVRAIRKLIDGYLDRLGLKREGVSCHSLRHTFATQARAAGARLDAIAGALGHSSIDTTRVYAAIVDRGRENPAAFLVGALQGIG